MNVRLHSQWDEIQSTLWFRPLVMALLAVLFALVTTTLDQRVGLLGTVGIGADNARAVLSAVATSMLTVVALVFSIIMVTLVLASQQFSPRILSNFMRDGTSQNVLSVFIGAFVYSLVVMGRISETNDATFVPAISVIIDIGWALISVALLIYFIDHVAKGIQANHIMREINRRAESVIEKLLAEPAEPADARSDTSPAPQPPANARTVSAPVAGYIQAVDFDELLDTAQRHDLVVELNCLVGDFVSKGGELLRAWPLEHVPDHFAQHVRPLFDVGVERTFFEDLLFGIRQLVDIALKAISPAVNDPTTAINCIDYLSNILVQAVRYPDRWPRRYDDNGTLRILGKEISFQEMVDLAFNQIRQYSKAEVTVTQRLLAALIELATALRTSLDNGLDRQLVQQRRDLLWQHACMISRSVEANLYEPMDRRAINVALRQLAEVLDEQEKIPLLQVADEHKSKIAKVI